MAHKTFISYKYSEARELRDRIIKAMGEDAKYYNGENGFSPNMSDDTDEKIWNYLKDMIWGTSVTIVIVSPHMTESDWIESEISYSLRKVSRDETQSQRNGVVAVIMKVNGNYDWFKSQQQQADGCVTSSYNETLVPGIIKSNRCNQVPKKYSCEKCKCINWDTGSYVSYVEEEDFLNDIDSYIEKAYKKSLEGEDGYDIQVLSD